jgi:hypothetical protein
MMAERGHFSLIQFVPDRGRAEGANVGVVVVCPKLGAVRVLMSEGNDSPKRRFGNAVVDEWQLDFAKTALEYRLIADLTEHPTLEALERIRELEGNALTMTVPRTVAVDDVKRVASKLFNELVLLPVDAERAAEEQRLGLGGKSSTKRRAPDDEETLSDDSSGDGAKPTGKLSTRPGASSGKGAKKDVATANVKGRNRDEPTQDSSGSAKARGAAKKPREKKGDPEGQGSLF